MEELVRERTRQLEEAQHELVAKERLAVLGQLTATVSHELRNPLGTVKIAIYLLGKLKDEGNLVKMDMTLDLADRSVKRCDGIINELLDFTRRLEGTPEKIDLGLWLQEILDEQTLPDDIELRKDLTTEVDVSADPERLRRAFINVFTNGMQALSEKETTTPRPGSSFPERYIASTREPVAKSAGSGSSQRLEPTSTQQRNNAAATICTRQSSNAPSAQQPSERSRTNTSPPTPSATPSPPTCSKTERTSLRSRSS